MAITDTSKITSAINKQGNSTDPGCGCGAVYLADTKALPAGDYIALQGVLSTSAVTLTSIVWKGAPWVDFNGTPLTSVTLDSHRITSPWYMNIESCTIEGSDALFYKRCK